MSSGFSMEGTFISASVVSHCVGEKYFFLTKIGLNENAWKMGLALDLSRISFFFFLNHYVR